MKVINGANHIWYGWCADYKPNHGMENNTDKCPHYKLSSCSGRMRAACTAAKAAASGVTTHAVAHEGQVTSTLPGTNALKQAASALTLRVEMANTPVVGTSASTPITPSNRVGII
eukprot:3914742-Ditylum_brightwellii.AAC.3